MFEKVEASSSTYIFYCERNTLSAKASRYFKSLKKHLDTKLHLLKKALLQNLFKPSYLLKQQLPYDIRRAVSNLANCGLSGKATATEKTESFQLSLTSALPSQEFETEFMSFFSGRGWEVNAQLVTYHKRRFGKPSVSYQPISNISSISALKEGQEIILTISKAKKEQ